MAFLGPVFRAGSLGVAPLTNTSPVMLQVPTGMSPRKSSYSSPEATTNHPTRAPPGGGGLLRNEGQAGKMGCQVPGLSSQVTGRAQAEPRGPVSLPGPGLSPFQGLAWLPVHPAHQILSGALSEG